jgi:hypothetical protein
MKNKIKLLYLTPHLSTGGMPQYLYALIAYFYKEHTIEVVDVTNSGGDSFVVQKNRITSIVPVHTLSEKSELLDVIKTFNPDVIHYQEIPQLNPYLLIQKVENKYDPHLSLKKDTFL